MSSRGLTSSKEWCKIKSMRSWALFVLILISPWSSATCPPESREELEKGIDRINRRYDDFFRHRREEEERLQNIEKGAGEVKVEQERRAKKLEQARLEYKRVPKDYAREEALRVEWEKSQEQRKKAIEMARLCDVQQRQQIKDALKKGRQIPELKEFDLEGY